MLLAALANSIGVLILARVIQGSGGAIFPLAFGIIRDEFPRDRAAQGIAMISAILGIGGGLGIVLAGPIIDTFDYHWLFWFPLVAVVGGDGGDDLLRPRIAGEVTGPDRLGRALPAGDLGGSAAARDQPDRGMGLGGPACDRPDRRGDRRPPRLGPVREPRRGSRWSTWR